MKDFNVMWWGLLIILITITLLLIVCFTEIFFHISILDWIYWTFGIIVWTTSIFQVIYACYLIWFKDKKEN